MFRFKLCLIPLTILLSSLARAGMEPPVISFQEFTLDNGLRLIVHEDNKAPVVAVNIWYHVGSKNERPGRTGFAHLFEHLMFQGSEHFDGEYLLALEALGATDLNGTTSFDRTNYFQTVPVTALDTVLWLESDRMGHLLGAIDQDVLDEQRGVVQNEKRQGENQPYGTVFERVLKGVFPPGHPYSWEIIGSMDDLEAAQLDDVRDWFRTWYGPDNAVLVVAGDVRAEEVLEKVQHYFGALPPGPALKRPEVWTAGEARDARRDRMADQVSQSRLYLAWPGPAWGSRDDHHLQMAARIVGGGKNSRLYKRLVHDDQIATDASLAFLPLELGGLIYLVVSAQPGVELADLEAAVWEEIERFIEDGPTNKEMDRTRTEFQAAFVRGVERVGGFGGKSSVLAESAVYGGRPDAYLKRIEDIQSADDKDLQSVADRWLSPTPYALEVHPRAELQAAAEDADRSAMPEPQGWPEVSFPDFQRQRLDNGLTILLSERHQVPVVSFSLVVDAGFASDHGGMPGTSSLALDMMDEGTRTRTALEISEDLAQLGARLSTGSGLDTSYVSLNALVQNLEPSLDIFSEVILEPTFPEEDLERQRKQYLAAIRQEKTSPVSMAIRILPRLLFGEEHAYGQPLTGSGTEESIAALNRNDLADYHETWFRPGNARLVVVGDITMDELLPLMEDRLGGWSDAAVPDKDIAPVMPGDQPALYIVDRPDSPQSVILAGAPAPPRNNPSEETLQTLNDVLGGLSSSRINMNLREDKSWAYGAFSLLLDARGNRPFLVYAPVQADRTGDAIGELLSELNGIIGDRPASPEEVARVRDTRVRSLPGRWETNDAVSASLVEMVTYNLPDDYWQGYSERLMAVDADAVAAVADRLVRPDSLIWVVIGDAEQIDAQLQDLGLGPARRLDASGIPIEP